MGGEEVRPEPQRVVGDTTRAAVFLVLVVEPGGEEAVRGVLGDLAGLVRSLGFRKPGEKLSCVTGIGSAAWDRLFAGPRPAELHPFRELRGARHTAPATPGDVLLHIRAQRLDLCFELAAIATRRLAGAARVVDETHGFTYFDQRDLLGFVDGTENPTGRAAGAAALIGDEDEAFAGGSYVIVQKYLHDLDAWDGLSVEQQQHVVGRTKLEDIELPEGVQRPDSHVAVNQVLDEDGGERQILRANMPFGSVADGRFGTFFIGYCRTPEVTEQMLRNMFLGTAEAPHDRILDFSTAVTGSLFAVPPAAFLDDLPPLPGGDRVGEPRPRTDGAARLLDSSLRIGSLKPAPSPSKAE